ncbi:YaaC family protein [Dokdonella sp.]|uniref:YaaC family protein n=1 Tax=Dokdonella sp. TaxID=2291710 RepID=UPI001AFE2DC2|nr:YaaC family protein [Dokdonella sp.]MBO9664952.1 hypothetical protein [Dokdonella sp.]
MPLPQPRASELLRIKDRPLEFSFWPMERTTRRYGLGARVFATDPWTVIRRSIERRCLKTTKDAASALIEQAEDFFVAAASGVKAAKPLLMYYCVMNLAKALVLCVRQRQEVDNAQHGVSERLDAPPNNKELLNAWLNAATTLPAGAIPLGRIQVFHELARALGSGGAIPVNNTRFDLPALMPQIVPGHRLWIEASNYRERFVSLQRIEFRKNPNAREVWIRMFLFADDLRRVDLGHQDFLLQAQLAGSFYEVATVETEQERRLICLDQANVTPYNHRPSDVIPQLVGSIRQRLWRTVLTSPPYRKYYCYAAPVAEHAQVLTQLLSIYAITFYLGSIVRYRPHHFDKILQSAHGPFVEAFLNDQPQQLAYLFASEFAEKEVTRAAIV